jgi:hypothetical protein
MNNQLEFKRNQGQAIDLGEITASPKAGLPAIPAFTGLHSGDAAPPAAAAADALLLLLASWG